MTTSLFDLTGRIALVTGSAQGLGHAIARGLGEAGAVVVLNDVDQVRLDAAVAGLRADGIAAHAAVFDVTDRAAIDAAVDAVESGIGPIEILVSNAGINHRQALEDVSEEAWDRLIDINVKGVFLVGQAVAARMLPRGHGKIINISSVNAVQGRASIGPYTAAKGAVTNLTKAMATEWAGRGLQVNAIGPGYFLTRMAAPLLEDPAFVAWLLGRVPAGRWGDPTELVGTAVYLASDASSFVNGQTIYVDGGLLARL